MKSPKTAKSSTRTKGVARNPAKGTSREMAKKHRGASQTETAVDLIRMKIIDIESGTRKQTRRAAPPQSFQTRPDPRTGGHQSPRCRRNS